MSRPSTARDYQVQIRNRLIESRLTPNAISLTGFALCVVAAVLVYKEWWLAGGIAFIVGAGCLAGAIILFLLSQTPTG